MTVALDPRDPTPLWAQLAAMLRRRLADGTYSEGFPTEMELVAGFGVSRATVREAIRRLREEGLLDTRRGSGTFVVRRRLEESVIGSLGLARSLRAAGHEEESTVLRLEEGAAGEVAAVLKLKPKAPVVWLERLRHADGTVLALERSALVLPRAVPKLDAADLERGSLYEVLAERCGIEIIGASEQVRAVTANEEEERLLELEPGEGVFEVERVSYGQSAPVEWRRSLLRGSAFVFSAGWGLRPGEE